MDWEFCISCDLTWEMFFDEIKRAFPSEGEQSTYSSAEYITFSCRWFSCRLEIQEDKVDDFSNYQVMKDVFGIMYSYRCSIHTISSYNGDYLWEMLSFIGTILKRVPGDAIVIFNGDEPIVYRHNERTVVDPGVREVEGLGIPYQVGKWEEDFFLR